MAGIQTEPIAVFGIADAKVFPITANTSAAFTLGTGIDIPAIQSLSLNPMIESKDLRGDDVILDTFARLEKFEFSFECSKQSYQAMAAMLGGTVTKTGTGATEVISYAMPLGTITQSFQLGFKTSYATDGAADEHFYMMVCKVTNITQDIADGEYGKYKFSGTCIAPNKTALVKAVEIVKHAATADLAGITA